MKEASEGSITGEEPLYIMCSLLERNFGISGSQVSYCELCRGEIHIAPTSQAMVREHPDVVFHLVCTPCGLAKIDEDGEPPEFLMAPGAPEELRHALADLPPEYVAEFLRMLLTEVAKETEEGHD